MEWGKLPSVDNVNWTLPVTDPLTERMLSQQPSRKTEFYIGTPAWGHKEWVGKIYPPKTKASDYLRYYSENFNTIELNTSHYRIPSAEQTEKWRALVSKDFRFCPKLFQGISHHESGMLDKALFKEWTDFLGRLGDHRGPCFAQFPPHFDYSKKALLFHFLQQWPAEFELALEFRHPSWFQGASCKDRVILPALTQFLQTKKIGIVITDVAGHREVLHTSVSAPFTILRFIGNDLHPSDFPRVKDWALRFGEWAQKGIERVFFFAHEPDDIRAPELSDAVIKDLNQYAGAELPRIQWVDSSPDQKSFL